MVRHKANFRHPFLPLCLLLVLLPNAAVAQTSGPPPIELWPTGCIYFFCLFRYRFDQTLGEAFQRLMPNRPGWLAKIVAWAVIIGFPWFGSYLLEITRPIIHGTAYFMRLQSGVPEPEDDFFDYLLKAGSQLLFGAFFGFVIQQYVKYVGGSLMLLFYRLKPELLEKYRESVTLFLAAAASVLIIRIAYILLILLMPPSRTYASSATNEPDILANFSMVAAVILLGLLMFRFPYFLYHQLRYRKPQQPVWFHAVVGGCVFFAIIFALKLYYNTSHDVSPYRISYIGHLFILYINIPILGFVAATIVEGLIKISAEARYMAIPMMLRPLVLSVATAFMLFTFYLLALWP